MTFEFLKRKNEGVEVKLTIAGMHCVSCPMLIDETLEELPGVTSSKTNYARGETTVQIDTARINHQALVDAIKPLGYSATVK